MQAGAIAQAVLNRLFSVAITGCLELHELARSSRPTGDQQLTADSVEARAEPFYAVTNGVLPAFSSMALAQRIREKFVK